MRVHILGQNQDINNDDDLKDYKTSSVPTTSYPNRLGYLLQNKLTEQVFDSNPDAGTEFDDRFFLPIRTGGVLDLPPQVLKKGQRLALLLWRKNVRAFAAVELVKDFVLGDGVKIRAADDKVHELLLEHWEVNEWEDKAEERIRALGIFGEQLYPAFVSSNGLVRISSITPFRIAHINRNPDDPEDLISVSTFKTMENPTLLIVPGTVSGEMQIRKIIKMNADGKLAGEAFYFAVNRVSGATRGFPDMLPSVDWLEGLDGAIFSLLERLEISQKVVYDIEYVGLDGKEVDKKNKQFSSQIKSGSTFTHNEKVKLNVKSPQLGAADADKVIQIIMRQINSGMRMAGLFFGDAVDLTRSSASELTVPVAKMIQGRQNFFKRMLKKIFRFQIEQGINHGRLDGVEDFSFEIEMAPIFLKDMKTVTGALTDLVTVLDTARINNWLTADQAQAVFIMNLEQLSPVPGASLDPHESLDSDSTADYKAALNRMRGNEKFEQALEKLGMGPNGKSHDS